MPFDDDLSPLDNPHDTPVLDDILASFDDTPLEVLLADLAGHDELLAIGNVDLLAIGNDDNGALIVEFDNADLLAIGNVDLSELAGNADLSDILAELDDTPL